jgi:hypothetical protein
VNCVADLLLIPNFHIRPCDRLTFFTHEILDGTPRSGNGAVTTELNLGKGRDGWPVTTIGRDAHEMVATTQRPVGAQRPLAVEFKPGLQCSFVPSGIFSGSGPCCS